MNIFLQCDIVEQSGHGVPIIVSEYGENAYKFSESSITVVIPFDKKGFEGQNVAQNVVQSSIESRLIELIKTNPKITRSEMASVIGKSIKTIEREIKKSFKIKFIGTGKSGHWKVEE